MKPSQIFKFCKKNRIKLPRNLNTYKGARVHSGGETKQHFLKKAVLFQEITKQGGTAFTEIPIKKGVADVFWLDEKMVIEFESNKTKRTVEKKAKNFPGLNVLVFSVSTPMDEVKERVGLC